MSELLIQSTGSLSGAVKCPPSKSYTIRAVVAGLLADGSSTVRDPLFSRDTQACMDAAIRLGADITRMEDVLTVKGTGGAIAAPSSPVDTENSGTTIRLLTGVAALSDQPVTLTGDESIRRRPIQELLDALGQLGVEASSAEGCPPVTVQGPLQGGVCRVRGDISSQFISSLLMSAPLAKEDTEIQVTTELKSRPYVDLTLSVLEKFGIKVENKDYRTFRVSAGQSYRATDYTVEGDYSSGAFLLAAGALTDGEVTVRNLFQDSMQADKKIIDILKEMGADVKVEEDSVTVAGSGSLKAGVFDLSDCPDLVPICAVLGACAKGETSLENVGHARIKECDRIHAMAVELAKMGCDIKEKQDGLVVEGGNLKGARLDGWRDHRIVMACAVAGLRAEGETVISDAEYADVTFPNFTELMQELGAKVA